MDERVHAQAEAGADALRQMLQQRGLSATWLMFGAHPDDEWNGFLGWLALARSMRTVYACATRGEGGQNALGPERDADLGLLRTGEMQDAAAEIGLELRWLSSGMDDPIHDFGFSRSAEDTLARWGADRLAARMADTIREICPDAVCPTFLDVPGQHGHHRAVTRSLRPAVALAADPGWRGSGLPPWQVRSVYLPAFSGGGGTYDDREPPPPATVSVDLGEVCPALGATWTQIGEWSRRHHASQGMGRWIDPAPRPWPLHLVSGPPDRLLPLDWLDDAARRNILRPAMAPASAPIAAPAVEVSVTPSRIVRRIGDPQPAIVQLSGAEPPPSWPVTSIEPANGGWRVTLAVSPGRTGLASAGERLHHVGKASRLVPATVSLLGLDARIDPASRVGVIAGASDSTLDWLRQLGIAAEALDDAAIAAADFGRFTTVLVGNFAFRQRPALLPVRSRLLEWIARGGSLVTLYHRPTDAWDADRTPPRRIVVGTPSFRWRVTQPEAPVRVLQPDHVLFTTPNRIVPQDWEGWVRERGLYFASEWDSAYTPLLEMADAGEPPLQGALLAAKLGAGSHVHVALALHRQWDALVPGAFRLLCNLVARP